ncbi:MAG: hypothetical protein LBT47_13980 [Deltaproteobacteria bacterium]|jgi:ribosome assembly protein YihI (activator of Der GTPase)|nr:hypothetical protein [Deltaproteobacteria bacterium]
MTLASSGQPQEQSVRQGMETISPKVHPKEVKPSAKPGRKIGSKKAAKLGAKTGKPSEGNLTKRQLSVLSELEKLAKKQGLKVSAGRLIFAGLRLKGGRCSLRNQKWVVLDRFQTFEEQLECFRLALESLEINDLHFYELSPETVRLLGLSSSKNQPAEKSAPQLES